MPTAGMLGRAFARERNARTRDAAGDFQVTGFPSFLFRMPGAGARTLAGFADLTTFTTGERAHMGLIPSFSSARAR